MSMRRDRKDRAAVRVADSKPWREGSCKLMISGGDLDPIHKTPPSIGQNPYVLCFMIRKNHTRNKDGKVNELNSLKQRIPICAASAT